MQIFGLLSLLVVLAVGALYFVQSTGPLLSSPTEVASSTTEVTLDPAIQAEIDAHADIVVLTSPKPNENIASPLTLIGKARGTWYFEGSFPVTLTDWDGRIIAEGTAMARGPWMTEDFVPFTLTLSFDTPYHVSNPDFMKRGSLILKKDNPSGLPEHDDSLEIPIMYLAPNAPATSSGKPQYQEALDQAHKAAQSLEI